MKPQARLILCGAVLCTWCIFLSVQSCSFAWGRVPAQRPSLTFTVGMLFATGVSLLAIRDAVRCRHTAGVSSIIFGLSIIMRLILMPSHPICELDIYRYMWDGLVVTETGNPWQFSPALVRETVREQGPAELRRLTALRDASHGVHTTLDRVHYARLTTIYPPVSQAVFGAAAVVTPKQATARTRLIVTRTVITAFDVLTILAVLRLLRLIGKPAGWSVCYAWSPLVLKEFANSGHLDAIAVCSCTWAVVHWIDGLQRRSRTRLAVAAVLLGLAVGAKLFPLVLVPVITTSVWRRAGVRCFVTTGLILTIVATVSLWPMFAHRFMRVVAHASEADIFEFQESTGAGLQTGEGMDEFLKCWKMNHFFFLLIEENLTPRSIAWFALTPQSFRRSVTRLVSGRYEVSSTQAAFLITRVVTTICFLVIVWRLSCQSRSDSDHDLLEASFLSLAWFWLLLPTMNPWYWIWAMPLLPFARQRTWLLMSGCVCLYYLRFWFSNSLGLPRVPGTMYSGRQFFRYVVVWIEYLPWCCLLVAEWNRHRRKKKPVRL